MLFTNDNAARYAVIFAADAGTEALYNCDTSNDFRNTDDVVELAAAVGNEAEKRRLAAEGKRDFYPVAFAEQAAEALRRNHAASLRDLYEAGQAECDSLAGSPEGGAA